MKFKNIFLSFFALVFAVYLFIGLQPAGAANYEVSATLEIPQIELVTDVAALKVENENLLTPDFIVGSYQRAQNTTLLIGHSTTVFRNLDQIKIGDEITYNNTKYYVKDIKTIDKTDVKMAKLLQAADKPTIILMTCAGERITATDFTKRLIIRAEV